MRLLFLLFAVLALAACAGDEEDSEEGEVTVVEDGPGSDLIAFGGRTKRLEGVAVYEYATVTDGKSYRLRLTGAGVRVKSVLITSVDVAVAASYIDLPGGISVSDPMKSIAQSKAKAIKMTMLRDVSAQDIRDSTIESLESNGFDINSSSVASLLNDMAFPMRARQEATFISITDAGRDIFHVIAPNYFKSRQGKGLGLNIWKLWFGNPPDDDREALKQALIGK